MVHITPHWPKCRLCAARYNGGGGRSEAGAVTIRHQSTVSTSLSRTRHHAAGRSVRLTPDRHQLQRSATADTDAICPGHPGLPTSILSGAGRQPTQQQSPIVVRPARRWSAVPDQPCAGSLIFGPHCGWARAGRPYFSLACRRFGGGLGSMVTAAAARLPSRPQPTCCWLDGGIIAD